MFETFLAATKLVAARAQDALAQQSPLLAQELDLPQRQRFLELVARGFDTFVHGLARATAAQNGASDLDEAPSSITLGPPPPPPPPLDEAAAAAAAEAAAAEAAEAEAKRAADDEAFANKFAQLFLDMGGIFPKLAQVLSMRPDLIKNERVLVRLRCVQEECKRMPFAEAEALAASECAEFRSGACRLKEWDEYIHAGSIAQVAPFVRARPGDPPPPPPPPPPAVAGASPTNDGGAGHVLGPFAAASAENVEAGGAVGSSAAAGGSTEEETPGYPDGIVKLTFLQTREIMAVDFRLLRWQLHWMERTGHWSGRAGLEHLRPKHLNKIKEVWRLMAGMEDEVLKEFDLRHELECQQRGALVIDSLVGDSLQSSTGEIPWLEEWRDGALSSTLRPAGPMVSSHAKETWNRASAVLRPGASPGAAARPGMMTRLARRAYGGRSLAASLAEGDELVARLRGALGRLKVRVPDVYPEASSEHVLAMAFAEGRSLKAVLDVIANSPPENAEKAAAWFAALLLFVIVPLWGKMLLVMGCCHADPHPGNFKVDGIPGLDEVMPPPPPPPGDPEGAAGFSPPRRGFLRRLVGRGGAAGSASPSPAAGPVHGALAPLTLWVLDWGSCVDVEDGMRRTLCRLLVNLSALRAATRLREGAEDGASPDGGGGSGAAPPPGDRADEVAARTREVADCMRCLGVEDESGEDEFLAALGMAVFDPSVASSHPALRGGRAEELQRSFPAESSVGKILRVVAILVGVCRELETRLNDEAMGRSGSDRPFVDLFLVDLWRPFAEEGLGEA